ncbi:MAG TPA: PLP-dependent aminotransferase family protein [Ktedonosporobacter sp.]|nr:PLP-dependent aminotransferase family protein [Ktedonosporobacter sp.]
MDYTAIHLQKEALTPLYQQIANQIKLAVEQGDLQPGEKLPPIRKLANTLGVSPITVTQAYETLAEQGVAGGQVGRGTFILPPQKVSHALSYPLTPQLSSSYIAEEIMPYASTEEPREGWTANLRPRGRTPRAALLQQLFQQVTRGKPAHTLINFSSGNPDSSLFSLAHWQQIMAQAGVSLEQDSQRPAALTAFEYGSALGDYALRSFLTTYLPRFGLQITIDNLLLTSGTQQGLDLVARTFLAPGDSIFVEQFSYIAALDIFEQYGVHVQPVPQDEHGIQVEALERLLNAPQNRPRLLYTIPTGQSPTGTCMTVERRRRLAELATTYNLLLIEDDPFNELYYEQDTPPPAIWSFASDGRVIYLKSFSKTTFPAVRLGCIVAAPEVLAYLVEKKELVDRGTSLLVARAILAYISSPAYERNVEQIRDVYRQRRDVMLTALERELAPLGCHWSHPTGGFNLLLTLPAGLNEMEVVEEAVVHGALVAPGRFFTPAPTSERDHTLRLTFANKPPEQLEEAARRLALALHTLLQRGGHSTYPPRSFTTDV